MNTNIMLRKRLPVTDSVLVKRKHSGAYDETSKIGNHPEDTHLSKRALKRLRSYSEAFPEESETDSFDAPFIECPDAPRLK